LSLFHVPPTLTISPLSLHDALPILNVAACDLLRNQTEFAHHDARRAADAHFQALHVGDGLELLAKEAAHLRAGVACGDGRLLSRSEEHTSELQSQSNLVCRLLLEKK